jgi:hypothetical protein
VRELRPGLWHWEAPHPDWEAGAKWPEQVSSYAIDDETRLILFDPIAPPAGLLGLAGNRQTTVVLTAPWHERATRGLVEQLAAPVWAPPPDSAQDLVDKFGITAEQAGDGSPDLRWLVSGEAGEAHPYLPGDGLPPGVDQAFTGREHNDLVLWVGSHQAVVSGDTLVDFGEGVSMNEWLRAGVTPAEVRGRLEPLLALPVEHVLLTHGGPRDRAALERALS